MNIFIQNIVKYQNKTENCYSESLIRFFCRSPTFSVLNRVSVCSTRLLPREGSLLFQNRK